MSESFIPKQEIEEALALFYHHDEAPVMTEHRFGKAAQALVDICYEAGIPIYENPALLEQLSDLSIGDHIPPELYRLVAEVLAFAFYIQGKAPQGYTDK